MNRTKQWISGATALMALLGAVAAPTLAQTSRQKDKNNMRNLGSVLGGAAAYKALKGDWKSGLVLGAGAAYSGKKYEDARKAQGRENNSVARRYVYKNGKRVGYYKMQNGKRLGYVRLARG